MKEFGLFLKKFLLRGVSHTKFLALVQSKQAQLIWSGLTRLRHSPALELTNDWTVPALVLVMLLVGGLIPFSGFELAKQLVINSPLNFKTHLKLADEAAKLGDYTLAQSEYRTAGKLAIASTDSVLGLSSELDEIKANVYPIETARENIDNLQVLLRAQPEHRDILMRLSLSYYRVGEMTQASDYLRRAKLLDPNNSIIGEIEELLGEN